MTKIKERQVVELLTRAVTLHQAGSLAEAAQLYRRVLSIYDRHADALHLLGVIEHQQGRHDTACALIEQALTVSPQRWAFYSNLACALQAQKKFDEAVAAYQKAIELGGESAALLSNLGTVHQDAGRAKQAEACYRRAIELDASHAEAHYNLGNLLREMGRADLALHCYETALRHKPNYREAHVNLANLVQDKGQLDEAVRSYRWALELNDHDAETHYNLARALKALGRYDQALAEYDRALQIAPQHAAAHVLRGLVLLRQGNFAEGWCEYEWRWRKRDEAPLRKFEQPLWSGQPLRGKTILVYSEQGVGDEIMFGSCIPDVIEAAEHCIIECDPRLVPLYRRSFAAATIQARLGWDDHEWLGRMRPIDYQVPVGNLPRFFRTALAQFPRRPAYLMPDPDLVARWRSRLAELGPEAKIGISWRGASDHEQKYGRSVPLADWAPLFAARDLKFINLQYGNVAAEIGEVESRLGIEIHDWEDNDPRRNLDSLAALMAALDLVITIGNSNAHLAGAIGANVWTLLPRVPSWRWMDGRDDSPWYPTMRLMRQSVPGGWSELMDRLRLAVRDWQSNLRPHETRTHVTSENANGAAGEPPSCSLLKKRRLRISDSRWQLQDATLSQAFARAAAYHKAGEPHHAEGILREILRHAPKHADALHRLGCLLKQTGRRDEAIRYLREAAEIAAAKPNFRFDLAVALSEAHQNHDAEAELWRVIELDPTQGPAYVNLGVIFERLGKLDEALSICQRGLKLMPDSPQAYYNLANVYLHQGLVEQALAHYDRLLQIDPKFFKGHWNRGLAHLLAGEFAQGWKGYQYREAAEQVQLDKFELPEWDGGSVAGKTLLVHAEQGVGDEIMFATCLPDVLRQARHVHVTCDPRLEKLFARSFPGATVHPVVRGPTFQWEPPPGIDVYTHAATLACYLRPDFASFPRQSRLLTPNPSLVARWRERFAQLGSGPKIGISWRAGGISSEQRRRTSLLDHWQPLFRLAGCHFVNLQYGDWSEDLAAAKARWGVTIHHWQDADPLADLDNFAAQVAALDAVVSVGNTTIHMAGALGIPTWTALPRVPGWRYLLREDWMPWYASVRLRRQRRAGDWDEVYQRIAEEIRDFFGPGLARAAIATHCVTPDNSQTELVFTAIDTQAAPSTTRPAGTLPRTKVAEAFVGALKQHRAGRLADAEQVYRQILAMEPTHADAHHLLGVIAHQTGRLTLALESIRQAVQLDPGNSVYRYNLASVLRDGGDVEGAIAELRCAVERNPHLAEGHLNLGTLLHAQGNYVEAMSAYERALAVRPDYAEAHNNIGSALRDLGRYEQAIACYRRAIELRPNYADAHLHLAGVLRELGRADEALTVFDRGLELAPQNADAHVNRAMLRIQQQRFAEGWDEWEWRWALPAGPPRRPFTQPHWQGGSLRGKTILVHMEQGVGDEIMLASCLQEIVDQSARTIVECEPRLVALFARSFPQATIRPRESWTSASWLSTMGTIDCQIPAGSLPRLLRRQQHDFPRQARYLVPDPLRVDSWRRELARCAPGLKVGISWRGGFNNRDGLQRSTSLQQWTVVAQVDGATFVNLQYGDCGAEIAEACRTWPRPLLVPSFSLRDDLDELAALIAALDLVISVSNVTVHMAGAVGTPCWTLLTRAPSWRWFNGLDEAAWYRSVRFIRQEPEGGWDKVFETVRARLSRLVAGHCQHGQAAPHWALPLTATGDACPR
jgi:tetratricopeptide (TPR) repeat protein